MLPEKPVLSIQMLEDRYALENHLLDAVHHGDAELAMQALQSFRGITIPGARVIPRPPPPVSAPLL